MRHILRLKLETDLKELKALDQKSKYIHSQDGIVKSNCNSLSMSLLYLSA